MSETSLSTLTEPATATPASLSTVVYRSRAASPLSAFDLQQLIAAAQSRNQHESITGLMLYDNSDFFQWLEGPAEAVDRIMRSIQNDPRHTHVEILNCRASRSRVFGDWNMRLAARNLGQAAAPFDVLEPPPEVVEELRRRPQAAPILLVQLVPVAADTARAPAAVDAPPARKLASILEDVFLSTVVPELLRTSPPQMSAAHFRHPYAAELADRLVAEDQTPGRELIAALYRDADALWPFCVNLFEPTARRLGDLWRDDRCNEFDVAIGLGRMQAALRCMSATTAPCLRNVALPAVLVAPAPGELHSLGAVLDGELFRTAGWLPYCEYPADDSALEDFLATTWCDALDLSLSSAFLREHRLPHLKTTIALARRASRNPALIVMVGGRIFLEQKPAREAVGADISSGTTLDIDRLILRRMKHLEAAPRQIGQNAPRYARRRALRVPGDPSQAFSRMSTISHLA